MSWAIGTREGWVRLGFCGWGVRWKDTRLYGELISERQGAHRQIRVGPWLIRLLPPSRRPR